MAASDSLIEKNLRLYPIYYACFNAHFWMPIYFFLFTEHLTLEAALQLQAIYFFFVFLMEVPSGYFADRFGRRITLIISSITALIAYLLFITATSFAGYAIAQALIAIGFSFRSGSDTALHYDSLAALNRTGEYGEREAKAERLGFYASGAAALVGGSLAVIDPRLAYVMSLLATIAAFICVLKMSEPNGEERADYSFFNQMRECREYFSLRSVDWLFAFMVAMIFLNHIPYEFYQPYLKLLSFDSIRSNSLSPLYAGAHMAITMLLSAPVAGRSIQLKNKFGLRGTLMFAMLIQFLIILCMGAWLHWAIALLALTRSMPRAIMTAPHRAALNSHISQAHRATFLSLQSLAGRLAFAIGLFILTAIHCNPEENSNWPVISHILLTTAVIAIVMLLLFWTTGRKIKIA